MSVHENVAGGAACIRFPKPDRMVASPGRYQLSVRTEFKRQYRIGRAEVERFEREHLS